MKKTEISILIVILILLAAGCSSGGMNPVIPDPPEVETGSPPAVEMIRPAESSASENAQRILLGLYTIGADPESESLEIISQRSAGFHLNAVPLLENSPEPLLKVAGPVQYSNGGKQLDLNIMITHPVNDPVFTAFDVRGILMSEGTSSVWNDAGLIIASDGETRLLNSDGYTRWWNPAEFTSGGMYGYEQGELGTHLDPGNSATLNGYKMFAKGLLPLSDISELNPALRGMLEAGASTTRHFTISLEGGLVFNYAVDASWAYPNAVPPIVPDDFGMNANIPEPYRIDVTEWVNTLWYASPSEYGGNVFYHITVYDWQGVDTIGDVRLEVPGLSLDEILTSVVDEGPGYRQYEMKVFAPVLHSPAEMDVLVSVDSTEGSYQNGQTGVDVPLRAYRMHRTDVNDTEPPINLPPVSLMSAVTTTDIYVGQSVTFDASDSYDPDGEISTYMWDFDGDEIYGDPWDTGDEINPTKFFSEYGQYDVRCQVEDNDGAFGISAPVTVNATFEQNQPPVAIAVPVGDTNILWGGSVEFDASESYDIDGEIVLYQWDFDGDGSYGDTYDSGTDVKPVKFYTEKAVFDVDLRVEDDQGNDDLLDEKILVTVGNNPPVAGGEVIEEPPYILSNVYHLSGSSSSDIDGSIISYEWDIDYDGSTFTPDIVGEQVEVLWDESREYEVQLRVIDDEGAEDYLDNPLVVYIYSDPVIDNIRVSYEASQKVTWYISGSGFGEAFNEIITDLPAGWNPDVVTWSDDLITVKYDPYTMDVNCSVINGAGLESNEVTIRESDGILVIYNINSSISEQVKDYYISPVTGRGISPEHVYGMDAPAAETINRLTYDSLKGALELWLTSSGKRYDFKFIVTCKGVPLRISKVNGSGTSADFACVDSELCLLFEDYEILGRRYNPYYSLSNPQPFHPGKFTSAGLTARYLVTRLTGYTYEEVTGLIDRCMNPYTAGDSYHILDGDPDIWYDSMDAAYSMMLSDGLNVYYDDTNEFVTSNYINDITIYGNVMTYTGHGIHHSPKPPSLKWYILDDLGFTYPNGALFNSYESSNGTTFTWENHSGHGMVGDFIRMGGSGGIGHVYEPYSDGVGDERVIGRWYTRGYSLAETQYMSLRYMSWTEVVAGEPLCRIAVWDG